VVIIIASHSGFFWQKFLYFQHPLMPAMIQALLLSILAFIDWFFFQHPMKPAMIPRPGMMQKQQAMAYHAAAQAQAQAHAHAQAHAAASASSAASQPGSLTHRSGAWQSTLSGAEGGRGSQAAGGMRGPQLVIPRAKVKPRSNYQAGYNSDDDNVSQVKQQYKINLFGIL
jgi:hypothetical protein